MPPQMLAYSLFAEMYGWDPRVVDQLSPDEEFWLPVVREAKMDAAEQLRDKT